MKNIIVGLGEILWDMLPTGKILGGAPANFAYHVSQFGFNGVALSAVGNDDLGKEILDSLEEKKLNHLVKTIEYPTGTVNVTLSGEGIPQYEICENVAWDNIPFTEETEEIAKNTVAVAFGSLAQRNKTSRDTIRQFLHTVSDDCIKIFDINLRQHFYSKEVIEESLELANILKINDEEVVVVAKLFGWETMSEQDVCLELIKKYDLELVILTKGEEGSFVYNHKESSFHPTPKVEVADTVGAGDSFTAAFIASYLNKKSLAESHQLAVEVSAYICTQHGAMAVLPNKYLNIFN